MPVRLDGKTVRGAKDADGNQRHPPAALVGRTATVLGGRRQAEVGVKTNEVPMAKTVLGQINLNGKLVTADALHTVKATAEFIRESGGEFISPVKENRKALFDALDALPWHQVPVAHSAADRGHGRITTRTIQVLPAPENLPFPHVSQVLLIERYVSDLAGNPVSAVAAFGVASPAADRASAADLAGHVREQWSIESLHWLRDTLYQEDKSQVRTRSGPRIMAAPAQPGHLRPAPVRPHRCHRSHPMGRPVHGPALHHPRPHIMILKRPWGDRRWPCTTG